MLRNLACSSALMASMAILISPTAALAAPAASPAPDNDAIVGAPDRTEADRGLDGGRLPAALLSFIGVRPGFRVAELAAGGGYTTEILARAVGPKGKVYGQNTKVIIERFAKKPWAERLARPAMKNVMRVDRELEDPLPPDANKLDAVVMHLFYHDTYWFGTDRKKMNQAVFRMLKPGGVFVVVDHSAAAGKGSTEAKSLHRVEESLVKQEILEAGFTFDASSDTWRHPADKRDTNVFKDRGSSDRFALRFKKP